MQTRMTRRESSANSSWGGNTRGSSRIALEMLVFVFTCGKGQNESDYPSVVNWKLKEIEEGTSNSQWQVSGFFLTASFCPFLRVQERELSQFHLRKPFHCLANLTIGNSSLTLGNQKFLAIFVALKGSHSLFFFPPSACMCVNTRVYIWVRGWETGAALSLWTDVILSKPEKYVNTETGKLRQVLKCQCVYPRLCYVCKSGTWWCGGGDCNMGPKLWAAPFLLAQSCILFCSFICLLTLNFSECLFCTQLAASVSDFFPQST